MNRHREQRNRGIRLLTSAAVLLYALLPQTGFCACDDCHCENKVPSDAVTVDGVEADAPKSCCCRATSCCSTSEEDLAVNSLSSDGSCSCSCSTTKETPPPAQDLVLRTAQVLEELKNQSHSIASILPLPEPAVEIDLPVQRFAPTMSRLPVRLHLLLLVLLN